ncbi:unnamed protein product, partial [Prorocentrum cordatum]
GKAEQPEQLEEEAAIALDDLGEEPAEQDADGKDASDESGMCTEEEDAHSEEEGARSEEVNGALPAGDVDAGSLGDVDAGSLGDVDAGSLVDDGAAIVLSDDGEDIHGESIGALWGEELVIPGEDGMAEAGGLLMEGSIGESLSKMEADGARQLSKKDSAEADPMEQLAILEEEAERQQRDIADGNIAEELEINAKPIVHADAAAVGKKKKKNKPHKAGPKKKSKPTKTKNKKKKRKKNIPKCEAHDMDRDDSDVKNTDTPQRNEKKAALRKNADDAEETPDKMSETGPAQPIKRMKKTKLTEEMEFSIPEMPDGPGDVAAASAYLDWNLKDMGIPTKAWPNLSTGKGANSYTTTVNGFRISVILNKMTYFTVCNKLTYG